MPYTDLNHEINSIINACSQNDYSKIVSNSTETASRLIMDFFPETKQWWNNKISVLFSNELLISQKLNKYSRFNRFTLV